MDFERDLRTFLAGVTRDFHLVDDAYQRMVVKAIEAAESVNPETVRGWLFRIALNEARELQRESARQGRLKEGFRTSMPLPTESPEGDGFSQIVSEEEKVIVLRALGRLDAEYQEVVVRRLQKGQTFATISEEMGRPLGTVLTWMRRALIQLRETAEIRQLTNE